MLRTFGRTLSLAVRHFSEEAVVDKAVVTRGDATGSVGSGRDTLGKTLLSSVFSNRSAVIAIGSASTSSTVLSGKSANTSATNEHALEICEWMTLQQDIKLLSGDCAIHLDLIAKVRNLASAEKFFKDLPDQMRGTVTCTAPPHLCPE